MKFKFNAMKLMKLMILIENEFKFKLQDTRTRTFSRAFVNKPFKFKFNAMKLMMLIENEFKFKSLTDTAMKLMEK